ncbi:DUF222 domain-containing protein, partial [Nocardia sp. SYP-A9097]|uniref:HNH endonuclease signature motif containing protein n=1 Tax=Nocardia sp. SYP-A9097 TaxID=2663237 RepID=UPI00129B80E7
DAMLAKFARPGMCNPADTDSPWTAQDATDDARLQAAAARDTRTPAQRNHDALLGFLRPELGGPAKRGSHRGVPVAAIMTMSIADVERAAGVATLATGGTVPISEALELAQQSKRFLMVFDHAGMPLHVGRESRTATKAQRLALIATERGCTRPNCSAPASRAQVHHLTEWSKGGKTDIENLTLACDSCHAQVHDGPGGWKTVKLGPDTAFPGRTAWIAPPHIDPTGTPQVNHRHHPGELMALTLSRIQDRNRQARERHKRWLATHRATPATP